MAAKSELQIVINADDKASQKIGKIRKALGGLGKAAKLAGKALKLAAKGAVAVGGAMAAAVHQAGKFEKGMREVNTLVNLGDKEFKGLTDQMLELSKQTGVATTELTKGLYQAISAGVPADNALDFMTIASKAAIGGVTEVDTAIDGLTTVINAFGLEASDAEAVADVMFTTVKLGKTNMEQLSTAMFQAAPLAASLGLGIEDVAGATATLTKSGVPTTVAMTQIRAAMVALTKPSADMQKLFGKMGVESGKAALETFGFQGTLEKLMEVTGGSEQALVKAMGRVEGFSAVLGLTGKNAAVAQADLAAMGNAGGATQTAFEEMNKSFETTFGILKNKISVELQKTGLRLIPKLIPIVEKLSKAYDDWTETSEMLRKAWSWFREEGDFIGALDFLHDRFPQVTKKLAEFYFKGLEIKAVAQSMVDRFHALVMAVKPLASMVGDELVFVFQGLVDIFREFVSGAPAIASDLLERLGTILATHVQPSVEKAWAFLKLLGEVIVGVVKPAIDEFMVALEPAQKQLAGLSDEFAVLKEAVGPALKASLSIIGAALITIIGLVASFAAAFIKATAAILPHIVIAVQNLILVFTGLMNFITSFWEILQGLFTGNTEQVAAAFQNMKDAVALIWHSLLAMITNSFEAFQIFLIELIGGMVEGIVGFFEDLRERLVGGSIIPEMLAEMLEAFQTWFSDIAERLTTWVKERTAQFVEFFKDLKKKFGEFAKQRLLALFEFLTTVGTMVKNFMTEQWERFIKFLKKGTDKLEDLRKKMLSWIQDRLQDIRDGWADVVVAFRKGWTSLVEMSAYQLQLLIKEILTFVNDFISIGEKFIGGMVQGVKNKISDLVDEISNAVADALAVAEEAFKMRSPSKEGIRIGENFGSALTQGIVDSITTNLPDISKALSKALHVVSDAMGLGNLMPASQAMINGSALNPNMPKTSHPQSVDRSRTINYNLTAQYRTEQSEARLIDDLSLLTAVTGGR